MLPKPMIRKLISQKRDQITFQQRSIFSKQIIQGIYASSTWKNATDIALYLPVHNEVNLTALLKNTEKKLYIPAIQEKKMQFHLLTPDLEIKQGPYQIPQPDYKSNYTEPNIDLCLTPLLGFDRCGTRLGMGGGYYDRYFEHHTSTILAGVGYALQEYDKLPSDKWDVKLHAIFTEKEHIKIE